MKSSNQNSTKLIERVLAALAFTFILVAYEKMILGAQVSVSHNLEATSSSTSKSLYKTPVEPN